MIPMRSRQPVLLTPQQREMIQAAARRLPPNKQYGFILRVENKLATRFNISDALVTDIIRNVLEEQRRQP